MARHRNNKAKAISPAPPNNQKRRTPIPTTRKDFSFLTLLFKQIYLAKNDNPRTAKIREEKTSKSKATS